MKRSVGQGLRSQEASKSSKMSKHDLEVVEETETSTTNGFLVETVLRRLFKIIESVSKLKVLRRMCQLWDRVDTEELEERAFQGLFKPINLTFFNEVSREFKPIKASSLEMREFLDDTSSNPRLFRSFAIVFPCSLTLLNLYKFRWFYTDYSPTFLELAIPTTFRFNQDKELLLKELLRWAAPTLRELVIRNIFPHESAVIPFPSRKSYPAQSFNFPHLRKMNMKSCVKNGILEAFKVIFAKENHPETPSLTSLKLRYDYPLKLLNLISNPSRWATLTMLEIKYDNFYYYQSLNPLTDGLLSLVQAGITLKKLHLRLYLNKNYPTGDDLTFLGPFRDLSQFFASQAGSLEALKLSFNLNLNVTTDEDQEGQIKIHLPVFERVHTLSLDLDIQVCTNDNFTRNIFEYGSISQHFPSLENLTINYVGTLYTILGGSHEAEVLNLKRLVISRWPYKGYIYDGPYFDEYLGFVEVFSCHQYALDDLRSLGDLEDTIRVLNIQEITSELDLSRFKGLRRVIIEENDKANLINELEDDEGQYLSYFKKVAELGLESIKFRGLEMLGKEKEFIQAFPFRVEFEDKPVDWYEEDFINN